MQVDSAYGNLVSSHHQAIDDVMSEESETSPVAAKSPAPAQDGYRANSPAPAQDGIPAANSFPPPKVNPATSTTLPAPPPTSTSTITAPSTSTTTATVTTSANATKNDDTQVNTADVGKDADDQMLVFHSLGSHEARQQHSPRSVSPPMITQSVRPLMGKDWRQQYLRREQAANCSLTGIDGIFESQGGGLSNFRLKVFASTEDSKADKPSFILWFVDTGGGELPEGLHQDQLEWLRRESAALDKQYGSVPGALYMHIPLAEFAYTGPPSSICKGSSDDQVTPLPNGLKLLPLLQDMHINWIFAGHNHGNDWCCKIQESSHAPGEKAVAENIQLCYGHHSGFGGYSSPSIAQTGARIFEFNPQMARKFLLHQANGSGAHSYVRLRYGGVVDDVNAM